MSVPDGSTNYTIADNILINASVIDDCDSSMSGLTTKSFNISNGTYSESYSATDEGTGYYSYSWDSTGQAPGWYNVTFTTANANYNSNYTYTSFYLSSEATLNNPSVDPSSGGWGHPDYNYSISVDDADGDVVNVSLWIRNATDAGEWRFYDSETSTGGLVSFTKNYTQGDIKNWSFKFNSTDDHFNTAEIYGGSHVVSKDNVTINLFLGNGGYVNRSDTQSGTSIILAGYVYDTDASENTTSISEGTFYTYITNDTITWDEQAESVGSYYYYDFNPTCNFSAAQQKWKMNVSGNSYYQDTDVTSGTVNVVGDLNSTYLSPTGLRVYERGSNIVLSGRVTDDCDNIVSGADVYYQINSSNSHNP